MASFNKIEIAAEMFVESHDRYHAAGRDIDYIVSILLSGAVIGIVGPLLEEQGGHTAHSLLARISNSIAEPGEPESKDGMFRAIYNALKHAGNDKGKSKVAASADLEIQTDLRLEAARMLDAAKQDFQQISFHQTIGQRLSSRFIALLESGESYA